MIFVEEEPNDASVVEANPVQGRLFTNDANTNNNIASGLLGVGLGIGGVLLTQHILEQNKQKERCYCPPPPHGPYHYRYKRDDGIMGRFLGLGENKYPKACPPCPVYPPRHQAPYHPPPHHHPAPARPQYPVNQGYAPAYPQQNYPAPQYPQQQNYPAPQYPQQNRYPSRPTGYQNPKPNYAQPAAYTPTPVYHQPAVHHHNTGYAPSFQGRSLPTADVVEETPAAKNEDAGSLLNGGAVRFGEK